MDIFNKCITVFGIYIIVTEIPKVSYSDIIKSIKNIFNASTGDT